MFFRITNVVKKIIIQELQALFVDHPVFGNGSLVITNKFQLPERPKFSIVVKTASAQYVKLGADNFKGIITSYTTLANLKNRPGRMIEWVREDIRNVENLVKPGFYVVEMVDNEKFTVQPYLTVADEVLDIQVGILEYQVTPVTYADLKYKNINPGSEYLISETAQRLLRDLHYTIDYVNGRIIFLKPIEDYGQITADYQYIGEKSQVIEVESETYNNTAIPGVILAFGNFLQKGGLQVVVVYPSRQEVARSYLGKWKLTVNLSITAQDTDTEEQLTDLTAMYLWSVLQDKLVNDGIYIENVNISGETEEDEVKTSNELAFLADLSFDINVEWEAYQPILGVIKQVFLSRVEDTGRYDDAEFGVRAARSFDSTQVGVDYKVGLQPVDDLTPMLVRPVPRYSLINSKTMVL